ncbi:MAG: helix-turn-helix transcriptional regulator [Clostridia bacterium]|nr:helix-turn-helix transcriptional regulator [Clostridia bacterium]
MDLERVCNYLGVSRSALTAAFRKGMNTTVMEYLMSFRVRVAKKHLAFTEIPQKEIALRCGFKTVQHFSRVFKQHTGQTPGDFRKTAVQRRRDEIK